MHQIPLLKNVQFGHSQLREEFSCEQPNLPCNHSKHNSMHAPDEGELQALWYLSEHQGHLQKSQTYLVKPSRFALYIHITQIWDLRYTSSLHYYTTNSWFWHVWTISWLGSSLCSAHCPTHLKVEGTLFPLDRHAICLRGLLENGNQSS